jgi:superfamily II DNA or RNA helicase
MTGKPNWRTAPPEMRARWEADIGEGLLCKAQLAAYRQGYDFSPEEIAANFSGATREIERITNDPSLPVWRKNSIHNAVLMRWNEERRMLAFATRDDVVEWRKQPRVDPAEVYRQAAERRKAERLAFIERRTAEIIQAEDEARLARARGQAEREFETALRAKGML